MIAAVVPRLGCEPLEELVPQESQLTSTGESVARQLPFPNQSAEVLDVHLEQFRGHRRREDGRELVHRLRGRIEANA